MVKLLRVLCLVGMGLMPEVLFAGEGKVPDYPRDVAPIFRAYCTGCHNPDDADGKLVLSSYAALKRGGKHGTVIVPGKPALSRMILSLEKKIKPFMPPEDNEAPTAKEIAILKAWIKAGAKGPAGKLPPPTLVVPKVKVVGRARRPITSLAVSPDGKWIAVGRYAAVEILSAQTRRPVRTLGGLVGNVNTVGFSADGRVVFAAGGQPGLSGQVVLWQTTGWKRLRTIRGHRDSIYAAALSPDGRILATGSYDKLIKLWETETGRPLRELKGHNGPVFGLSFRPGGQILASASGDRTVKLWDTATGKRLDTFSQPTKAQYAVAFSPGGRFVVSGGVDHRVRVWRVSKNGLEGTNPLVFSRFAHDAPLISLVFAPDGRRLVTSGEDFSVKVWETKRFTQLRAMKGQPDWVQGLGFGSDNRTLVVGRLDGSLSTYRLRSKINSATNSVEPITRVPLPKPYSGPSVKKWTAMTENEPNDLPRQAMPFPIPGKCKAVLTVKPDGRADADLYRFRTQAGRTWVIETAAARYKSPADTKIEVLDDQGQPVLRYLLRAVRDSYITFRPINSSQNKARVKNWREMTLNEFMYMNGEVCKLFQMPEGPDSGFLFYASRGKRRCYFDTSATVHTNGDPVYIVQAYPPGTKLTDNGLPVFPLYYANDDDGERELGSDSRLTFTAPRDGSYLVRVTDVRGLGGANFRYQLTIRPPRPDFKVTIGGQKTTIPAGSGQRLTVTLDRIDHFDGPVRVEISGLPPGFHVTSPIVVEAGHLGAYGVITADAGLAPNAAAAKQGRPVGRPPVVAPRPVSEPDWSSVRVTATAMIFGHRVRKDVGNLGNIKVGPRPKLIVSLLPDRSARTTTGASELVVKPGATVTAVLHIDRNGENGPIRFDVENLPHGVIVANLGLNGITLLPGQTDRRLFIRADAWVPESTRLIFATSRGAGRQASRPLLFHVRSSGEVAGR